MLSVASEGSFYMDSQGEYENEIDPPTIEGYKFVEKISDSGCSSNFLYRGKDGDLCVAKVLYNNCSSYEKEVEFLNFFKEEREVVDIAFELQSNNENIIMTKYCKYGDLHHFIVNMTEISSTLFIKIITELVKAVYILHENNIYHGDIKPANFFVRDYDPETENIQIVIADFGFAKDLESTTECLMPDGLTPGYSAPEVECNESVSLASDIFSLGRVFEFIYDYVYEKIPCNIYLMMNKMIEQDAEDRPSIQEIADELVNVQLSLNTN